MWTRQNVQEGICLKDVTEVFITVEDKLDILYVTVY